MIGDLPTVTQTWACHVGYITIPTTCSLSPMCKMELKMVPRLEHGEEPMRVSLLASGQHSGSVSCNYYP